MAVTIDDAIEQYKHISKAYDEAGNTDDSAETHQISEWLRKARGAEKAARWYTAKIRELEEEIEGLRQELAIREGSEQEKVIHYLSEQSVDWEDRYRALASENAKLRELMREMWEGYADPPCEECLLKDKPICADCPICAREALVIERMRELRIEVSDV